MQHHTQSTTAPATGADTAGAGGQGGPCRAGDGDPVQAAIDQVRDWRQFGNEWALTLEQAEELVAALIRMRYELTEVRAALVLESSGAGAPPAPATGRAGSAVAEGGPGQRVVMVAHPEGE